MTPFIVLAVAFVVPFVDPRRPFGLIHADVLALALFPLYFVRYMDTGQGLGSIRWATLLATIGLVYLFDRMIFLALRPNRRERDIVPFIPVPLVAVAAVVLIALHIAFPRLEGPSVFPSDR